MGSLTGHQIWFFWAMNLLAQNFMFTIVSRARNSGSLRRHVLAAIGSNGVWMLQFQILVGPMMDYLNGKHGVLAQVGVGAYYTVFTVAGSIAAHYWALKTEKGKSAVGASKKYVQITPEQWAEVQQHLSFIKDCPVVSWPGFSEKIDELARQAHESAMKLQKVNGELRRQ